MYGRSNDTPAWPDGAACAVMLSFDVDGSEVWCDHVDRPGPAPREVRAENGVWVGTGGELAASWPARDVHEVTT